MSRAGLRSIIVLVALIASTLPVSFAATAEHDAQAVIDFEGLAVGPLSVLAPGAGIRVTSGEVEGQVTVVGDNPRLDLGNEARVFDSTCDGAQTAAEAEAQCTGGDDDLWYGPAHPDGEFGNIAIVWDGNAEDPGDADERDATLSFDFSALGPYGVVDIEQLTVLDIEAEVEEAHVRLFDLNGDQIGDRLDFAPPGDNAADTLVVGVSNVARMVIDMGGSGAIDNIKIRIPATHPPTLTKSASPASGATVAPGSELSYSLTVTNPSADFAANGVRVVDTVDSEFTITSVSGCENAPAFDGATVDCLVDIPASSSSVVTITGVVTDEPTDCTMSNTATIRHESVTGGSSSSNTVDHRITPSACQPPTISKSAAPESGSQLSPEQALTYSIVVSNPAQDGDAQTVTVLDTLDADFVPGTVEGCANEAPLDGQSLTCDLELAPGGSSEVTVTGAIVERAALADSDCALSNTATLVWGEGEEATASNAVDHTIDPAECEPSDVSLVKDGPDAAELEEQLGRPYVEPGDQVTFTVAATNNGDGYADDVAITDVLDEAFAFVSVEGQNCDATEDNGTVSCDTERLAPGATATMTVTVDVARIPTEAPCSIPNHAEVAWATPDGRATSTSNDVTVPTRDDDPNPEGCDPQDPEPRYRFAKTADEPSGTELSVGDVLTYTLTVAETTDLVPYEDAITVIDVVPSALDIISVEGCDGYVPDGNIITCLFVDGLTAGETKTVTIQTVISRLPEGCVVTNTAEATPTPEGGESPSSTSHPVDPEECEPSVVSVEKSATLSSAMADRGYAVIGDEFSYTVSATNSGDGPAYGVVISDTLDASLTAGEATGDNCDVAVEGATITCTADRLAPGATATLTIPVTYTLALTDYPCQIPNRASVAHAEGGAAFAERTDLVLVNAKGWDTAQPGEQCERQEAPALSFVKTADPADGSDVEMGDAINYSLTLTETTGQFAWTDAITVVDDISPYLTIDGVDNCPGYLPDGNRVECLFADGLPAGGSETVTIRTRVTSVPVGGKNPCIPNSATLTSIDAGGAGDDDIVVGPIWHHVALACTGLDTESLSFSLAFSMIAIGGVFLHAARPRRREDGGPLIA